VASGFVERAVWADGGGVVFDRMFTVANPGANREGKSFTNFLNPDSLRVEKLCRVEPGLADLEPGASVQFERLGYFVADLKDSKAGQPVFNRVVTLRDSWAKIEKAQLAGM